MKVEVIGPVSSMEDLKATIKTIEENYAGSLVLYRGQNKRHDSIRSGRSRPNYRPRPLVEAGWSALASKLLGLPIEDTHSAKVQAILQHYGYATNFVDLTSDVEVAAWFASHKYSSSPLRWIGNAFRTLDISSYEQLKEGKGYVFVLAIPNFEDLLRRDRLIDLSVLPPSFFRPSCQKAWLLMDRPPTKPLPNDFWVTTIELNLSLFVPPALGTEDLFPPVALDGAYNELTKLPFAQIPAAYFEALRNKKEDKPEPEADPEVSAALETFCMAERLLNLPEYSEHDHKWTDLTIYEPHPMRMWKHWRAELSELYGGISGNICDTVKITLSPTAKAKMDASTEGILCWPRLGSDAYFVTFAQLDHDKVIEHSPPYFGAWLQRDADLILEVPMSSDDKELNVHPGHPYFFRDGKLRREFMDSACKCGDPESHDRRVISILRLQHLVETGQLILLPHPYPLFCEDWFYVISGDESEAMNEHVQRGKAVIGMALQQLRSGLIPQRGQS